MSKLDLAAEHIAANVSALAHYADFGTHRTKLTEHAIAAAPSDRRGTLCVLGAGNCFDLDLARLTTCYAQIHLVDIDEAAIDRAVERQDDAVRSRITTHPALDLSGLFECVQRWARLEVTPEELMAHASNASGSILKRLRQTFDVVLSACMLSQMQLSLVHALGDTHPLFQATRWTLNLTHFRTLAALTKPQGHALFATDVTASHLYPLTSNAASALPLLDAAVRAHKVFDFADPTRLQALLSDDPVLRRALPSWAVNDAWLWTNGPDATFLVYICALARS
jgi:hypothetical protein